jgi:hypothetical protein
MSQLGQFLEVVYGPREPFSSVRATIRRWRHRGIAKRADGGHRKPIGRRKVGDQPPEAKIDERKLSVRVNRFDQYRIEQVAEAADSRKMTTTIVNGEKQWNVDDQGQVETSERHGGPATDIARHFALASLREYFVSLTLEPLDIVETAGRTCLRLRAMPRPSGRLWPHWLPCRADEYEFHADLERGVLLYIAGKSHGEIFEVMEVTQVAFDEPLDESLFICAPDAGQSVRPATPIVERMTLETAVARMPFTVLVPTSLPYEAVHGFEVMFHPARSNSPRAYLSLVYRGERRAIWINESDRTDLERTASLEWEQIESRGMHFAISDPGVEGGKSIFVFEQHGTHIDIMSDLDRQQLIDLAMSLAPAKVR